MLGKYGKVWKTSKGLSSWNKNEYLYFLFFDSSSENDKQTGEGDAQEDSEKSATDEQDQLNFVLQANDSCQNHWQNYQGVNQSYFCQRFFFAGKTRWAQQHYQVVT